MTTPPVYRVVSIAFRLTALSALVFHVQQRFAHVGLVSIAFRLTALSAPSVPVQHHERRETERLNCLSAYGPVGTPRAAKHLMSLKLVSIAFRLTALSAPSFSN